MVGIGILMLFTAFTGLWLLIKNSLDSNKGYLRLCLLMGPSGFIAVIAGWITAEVGRQPYTVYGLLKTVESTSPVTTNSVGLSLVVFIFTYVVIFSAGLYYIFNLVRKGPVESLHPAEELESEPVLGTRLDIAEYEHRLKQLSHSTPHEKPD